MIPTIERKVFRGLLAAGALASAAICMSGAWAQEATLPVPSVVIYPGDIIRDGMLTNLPIDQVLGAVGPIVEERADLIGKVAKRTLLPGQAILLIAVGTPRAVVNGAEVTLFYREGGLKIVTAASALQDGSVGDLIKVRNIDSGITVSGVVQPDGSVRVGGG